MTNCEFCSVIKGEFESEKIYEDDKVIAVLHLKPATPGHILVFPKEHFSIIEQVPEALLGYTLNMVNRLSMAMFEATEAHGSNIIIQNGPAAGQTIPHFAINIIPRKEGDKLDFQWKAEKAGDDSLDSAQAMLIEQLSKKEMPKEEVKQEEPKKEAASKSSYKIKQLKRIP